MKNYDNTNVKRQDRLLEENRAMELLKNGEFGFLSMVEEIDSGGAGYGIPLNFVWDGKDSIYFHCAPEGHKTNSLEKNNKVSFCIVGSTNIVSNKFTTGYESIIIRGAVDLNLSPEEKMSALEYFLDKYSPNDKEIGLKYAEKSFHRTLLFKLTINQISGKTKQVK